MKKQLNHFTKFSVLMLALCLSFYSCNKDKDEDTTPDDSEEQVNTSSDETRISGDLNQSDDDINALLTGSSFAGARTSGVIICGASVDSSNKANGIMVLNFDGTTDCGGRSRSGSITVSIPSSAKWNNAGTMATITYSNYKVTRLADNKFITFNGTKFITNTIGGLVKNLAIGGYVTHKVRGSMNITFDDGNIRSWQIARSRQIIKESDGLRIQISGDTSIAANSNVDVWGTNRFGNTFYGCITNQIVLKESCNFRAIQGTKIHKGLTREITITFGVDATGNPINSGCAHGFKVNWTNRRNENKEVIVKY